MACHFGKSNNLLVSDTSMTLARISHTSSRYATYFQLRNYTAWWRHQMETFRRYWPFVQRIIGHRWIPRTKASDAELWCFLWSAPWMNCWVNNRQAGDAIALIMMSLQWNNAPMPYCVILHGHHWYLYNVTQNTISCHLSPISTLMMAFW